MMHTNVFGTYYGDHAHDGVVLTRDEAYSKETDAMKKEDMRKAAYQKFLAYRLLQGAKKSLYGSFYSRTR